jgi:hypothetical protein
MKLTPTRPVTIYAQQHAQIWFPQLHRHTDGTLFINFEKGYDRHFAPFGRLRSLDHGSTWFEDKENVPRMAWPYSFADGELFEMDSYGVSAPAEPGVAYRYGAWSQPSRPDSPTRQELVRIDSPNTVTYSARQISVSYPTHPWWELINQVHGKDEVGADELRYDTLTFFRFLEVDGVLLGLAAAGLRDDVQDGKSPEHSLTSTLCFESHDRGRSWSQRSIVARGHAGLAEGFSEGTFVQLKDGRLYAVLRTGGPFYHVWSSDGGFTWTEPELFTLSDIGESIGMCWPNVHACADGTLVMVWGRHGKHMAFDPSGTGRQWQGHLDLHAWELDSQAHMSVPPELRLRGETAKGIRHHDSGDMLSLVEIEPHTFLVCYDVQCYYENWNSRGVDAAIRLVRVRLESCQEQAIVL